MQSIERGTSFYQTAQIDLNFGLGDRIQLTYEVPYVNQTNAGQPLQSGWGNGYPGIKWRFLEASPRTCNADGLPVRGSEDPAPLGRIYNEQRANRGGHAGVRMNKIIEHKLTLRPATTLALMRVSRLLTRGVRIRTCSARRPWG